VRLGEDAVDRRGEHLETVHGVPADDDRDAHNKMFYHAGITLIYHSPVRWFFC
jgi:hypothetical protein